MFGIRNLQANIVVLVRWRTPLVTHIVIETLRTNESDDCDFISNEKYVCMLLIGDIMAISMKE